MLRVSANKTATAIDIGMINGTSGGTSRLPFGDELMHFAESLAGSDENVLAAARAALLQVAGAEVLVDAAGVAGNFQRMVRIADSMGIPVDSMDNEISNQVREELDLYRFKSAENSPALQD